MEASGRLESCIWRIYYNYKEYTNLIFKAKVTYIIRLFYISPKKFERVILIFTCKIIPKEFLMNIWFIRHATQNKLSRVFDLFFCGRVESFKIARGLFIYKSLSLLLYFGFPFSGLFIVLRFVLHSKANSLSIYYRIKTEHPLVPVNMWIAFLLINEQVNIFHWNLSSTCLQKA